MHINKECVVSLEFVLSLRGLMILSNKTTIRSELCIILSLSIYLIIPLSLKHIESTVLLERNLIGNELDDIG